MIRICSPLMNWLSVPHKEPAWRNFEPEILQAKQELSYSMTELKVANI